MLTWEPRQASAVVLLCAASAIVYGVVHDEITARVSLEYFTVGHPDLFGTNSPTLLGLGWGTLATWWVGLGLGIGLAGAARLGGRPQATARELVRPLGTLLTMMAACALGAGLLGDAAARRHWVWLDGDLAAAVPAAHPAAFLAALWAHMASYGVGIGGGCVLMVWTWRGRRFRLEQRKTST